MGIFRFVLAFYVVLQHVAKLPGIGVGAVFGFFVLSGFLMTHVTCRTYGHTPAGFASFWTNRLLRLWPGNLAVVAVTCVLGVLIGWDVMTAFHPKMYMPQTAGQWLENLALVYTAPATITAAPRLVEPSWALTVELGSYFLISLGVSATAGRTLVWMAVGLAYYLIVLLAFPNPALWAYGTIPAGFFPFAVGGMIYHRRARVEVWARRVVGCLPGLGGGNAPAAPAVMIGLSLLGFVLIAVLRTHVIVPLGIPALQVALQALNVVPAVLGVAGCLIWRAPTEGGRRIDRWAGDMSYPIYLSHYPVAFAMTWGLGVLLEADPSRWLVLLASLPVLALVCWAMVIGIDRPVDRLRDRVRSRRESRAGDRAASGPSSTQIRS